ncbi:NAD(P)/FAD-dependent oxidoreductase [Virgibacillus ndiopensis]|uniref:NAD(P)/FAD-dependent oxidoreductase n=1 Tax=Virgibacillus ndiopensis TaxID=2004408 RepID=UPI000C070ADC|nr:FAD-dependent oxidoreductase [Virgibacillus ndiopensis]
METDLLIIGGGPAGLHAAYVAASNGIKTIVVDESFSLGGQLRQQTQRLTNLPKQFDSQIGITLMQTLVERLTDLDVTILSKHTMIGTYKDGRIGVSNGQRTIPISAEKVIVTTGAAEEAFVFPGWTLPGVMTIGAAQIVMNREHVIPGKNAIIIGSNDFALEVGKQLIENGVSLQGVIENEDQLIGCKEETIQFLKEAGVPIYQNSYVTQASGAGEVEKVIINHNGSEKEMEIDLVCIGKGLTPILEPFEILSCDFAYEKDLGGWLPQYSTLMETSTASIYVAGNAAGITNLGAILLTAEIAAISVAESLGRQCKEEATEKRELLWQELYHLESADSKAKFHGRIKLMREFQDNVDIQLSKLFNMSVGGV